MQGAPLDIQELFFGPSSASLDLRSSDEHDGQESFQVVDEAARNDGGDDNIGTVDWGLPLADVLNRIETVVQALVEDIASGVLPSLTMTSRSSRNNVYRAAGVPGTQSQQQEEGTQTGTATSSHQQQVGGIVEVAMVAGLGGKTQTKSLLQNQGASAFGIARVFKLMAALHELLRDGRQATQRDLYYKLQGAPLFCSPADVTAATQDLVALTRVPRSSLGICCAPRGTVAGCLYVREGATGAWQDCTACGLSGRALPGDLAGVDRLSLRCAARYLLIVEKDAVFQRLAEDRVWDAVPCVLLTAKGFPDLATRAFAARLAACFPQLTVLGLVDFNPAGVTILRTYKCGGHGMAMESHKFALPHLRWLGVRSAMLADVPASHLQPLTRRDLAMLPGLRTSLQHPNSGTSGWVSELDAMEACGHKGDIEALYCASGFKGLRDLIAGYVLRGDYI